MSIKDPRQGWEPANCSLFCKLSSQCLFDRIASHQNQGSSMPQCCLLDHNRLVRLPSRATARIEKMILAARNVVKAPASLVNAPKMKATARGPTKETLSAQTSSQRDNGAPGTPASLFINEQTTTYVMICHVSSDSKSFCPMGGYGLTSQQLKHDSGKPHNLPSNHGLLHVLGENCIQRWVER